MSVNIICYIGTSQLHILIFCSCPILFICMYKKYLYKNNIFEIFGQKYKRMLTFLKNCITVLLY